MNFNVSIASHFRAHAPLPNGYSCMGRTCAAYARVHKLKSHVMEIDTRVHQSIDDRVDALSAEVPFG